MFPLSIYCKINISMVSKKIKINVRVVIKVFLYIAQCPVRWTAQSFTLHPLANV